MTSIGRQTSPLKRPKKNGSDLIYDSYEFCAVMKQLNSAIQGPSSSPLSPYSYYVGLPLDRIRIQPLKASKRLSGSQDNKDNVSNATKRNSSGGLVACLWGKVKWVLIRKRTG
ncbi:hypothetical protein LIER_37988 [Lithospermum erythrorhizon]|uniref:Uncharacterized protein n=1 Tax=Lithospermum erythrorhizon TaxID=34254 RepID=A0AAV3PX02_LITER